MLSVPGPENADLQPGQTSGISNGKSSTMAARPSNSRHRRRSALCDGGRPPQKLPSMPEEGDPSARSFETATPEPRPLLKLKGMKVIHPKNARESRVPRRAGEALKPLGPPDDDGFEPADDLAVVGIAITHFGKGWDLPPGVCDDAADDDCECDVDCGEDCPGDGCDGMNAGSDDADGPLQ
jgi:hypothetical protein